MGVWEGRKGDTELGEKGCRDGTVKSWRRENGYDQNV